MMLPEGAGKRVELQELALRADGCTDEDIRINDTRSELLNMHLLLISVR